MKNEVKALVFGEPLKWKIHSTWANNMDRAPAEVLPLIGGVPHLSSLGSIPHVSSHFSAPEVSHFQVAPPSSSLRTAVRHAGRCDPGLRPLTTAPLPSDPEGGAAANTSALGR